MKRNAQIHLRIETFELENLKKLSESRGLSLNEFCLSKIIGMVQLDRIEEKLNRLLEKNGIK